MDRKPLWENLDPSPPDIQPSFFTWEESASAGIELFPGVWSAAESLSSPDLKIRETGLARLAELNAARYSPLIAYLLVTRLTEPDLHLRGEVVQVLASVFQNDDQNRPAPQNVRLHARASLARMRTREVYALLQVSEKDPRLERGVAVLFNACPMAGRHLGEILANRKEALPLRRQAVRMLRQVGYLDAIPLLERLAARLEARLSGQQAMPFAPPGDEDETGLLPEVRKALFELQSQ